LNRISDSKNSERNNEKRNLKALSSMQSTQLLLLICYGGIQNLKNGTTGVIRDLGSEAVDVPTRIDGRVDRSLGIHSHPQRVDKRVRRKKGLCPIRNVRNKYEAARDNGDVEAISCNTCDKMESTLELKFGFFDG